MGLRAALASLGLLERPAPRAPQGHPALVEIRESEDLEAQRGSRESPAEWRGEMAQAFLDLRALLDLGAHRGTQDPGVPQDFLEQL